MAGGNEEYYLELAKTDYYTKGGEPPGVWWGKGASRFGLEGEVQDSDLKNLFRGYSADGSTALVRNAGDERRRAGFDLTFSAEKTVSIVGAIADADVRAVVGAAHTRAVQKALGYVEDTCAGTRTGAQGTEREKTDLTVAIFEHGTARVEGAPVPDPQLHSHCLVLNLCHSRDGQTRALDGSPLFRHNLKLSAGALYRAELFSELERTLGLMATKRGKFSQLDIVPEKLRAVMSKRRAKIESYLEERGLTGAKAAAYAALESRTSKQSIDREAFSKAWKETAAEYGFSPEVLQGAIAYAPERDRRAFAQVALEVAKAKATEQTSHFSIRELIRFVAEEVEPLGVGSDLVREVVETALASSPDLVRLGTIDGDIRYTTKEMLELEVGLLEGAERMAEQTHGVGLSVVGESARRFDLVPEQRTALSKLTKGNRLGMLRGFAGTGKTYLLKAARFAWEAAGFEVQGAALASAAAEELQKGSGIQSQNVHRMLWALESRRMQLSERSVVVIDEASMVGTRQLKKLVTAIEEAGAKLVLVGDDRQLPAIEAGAPFRTLWGMFGGAELTTIIRQKEEWAKEAVLEFSRGEAGKALARFKARGLLHLAKDERASITKLVSDWKELSADTRPRDTLVLTGTHVQAFAVNREIQAQRFRGGELGPERLQVGSALLHKGDRVLFRKNSPLVKNGNRGTITGVDETSGLLTVKLDGGRRVSIDVRTYQDILLGYAGTTHAGQGATLQNCLVLVGGSMQDREATYVQASRAKAQTRLYADQLNAGPELEDLVRDMSRSRQKDMALEVAKAVGSDVDFGMD